MNTFFLCLLLEHFPAAPQWLSCDILQWLCARPLVGAVRLRIWKSGREIDGIFLDGVFDQCDQQTKVILQRWGRCLCRERQAKKDEGSGRSITPWHPVLGLNSVCQSLISASSLKSLKTNKYDGLVKYPLEDCSVTPEASADTKAICLWVILAPVGMPITSEGHNEISLNTQTFWACALLEVDKCALQKLLSGMHVDSFMALSKTEPAWLMVSFPSVPAGRCLCICVLTSISICISVCVCVCVCVCRWGTLPEIPFLYSSVLVSDLLSTDFWCIPKSWVHPQIYTRNTFCLCGEPNVTNLFLLSIPW